MTSPPQLATADALDAMDAYPVVVETVFNDNNKTKKLNTKDFDSVIDKFTETIEMFPNKMSVNDGFAITQHNIDQAFVIPTPKTIQKADRFPIVLMTVQTINRATST